MMVRSEWEQINSRYLSTALRWLRLRLEQAASPGNGNDPGRRKPQPGNREAAKRNEETQVEIRELQQELSAFETGASSLPALPLLRSRLGLSRFEQDLLLLCAACEFDPAIAHSYSAIRGGSQACPTFALALSLFDDAAWDVLSPQRPLRYWKLIEIHQHGSEPLTTSPLRADERIVNFIKGLNHIDDRLSPYLKLVDAPEIELPESQQRVVDQILAVWMGPPRDSTPLIQLLGPDRTSKLLVAAGAARAAGRDLYRMNAEFLPAHPNEAETLIRLWQRESMLLPTALFLDVQDVAGDGEGRQATLRRIVANCVGPLMLASRELDQFAGRNSVAIDIAKPTALEQQRAWEAAIGQPSNGIAATLAAQFSLNTTEIEATAEHVLAETGVGGEDFARKLWGACRSNSRPKLDALAHRIDIKARWEHIVLPAEQTKLLHQIAAQVQQRGRVYGEWGFAESANRGLGISALFAGDSGTGKTMAAEVIANALELNLYRIELSAVVSKYLGETEKNLCRIFDAADDGGAILFFDEADALFGKRSEVKDSHDRYANIEINYLLQRMEGYRGLAILATNMKGALDPAFMRRLRFIVSFPFPSSADRKRIWQKVFPPATPVNSFDYDRLSRLNLTGGSIYNIALNAAFLAAQAATPVTMSCVLEAARTEFVKLDRPVDENDFRPLTPRGVTA